MSVGAPDAVRLNAASERQPPAGLAAVHFGRRPMVTSRRADRALKWR